jgi:hypothetical protein
METNTRFIAEARRIKKIYNVRVTNKREKYWLWRCMDVALKILTLGKKKNFLTECTTTFGRTVYFPVDWTPETSDDLDIVILHHELVHVSRIRDLGGEGGAIYGMFWFILAYLFLPFPIGLAWFRYKWEREAYRKSVFIAESLGYKVDTEIFVQLLSGPDYFWAWPFKKRIRKWFSK